jgi:hypothetical protein
VLAAEQLALERAQPLRLMAQVLAVAPRELVVLLVLLVPVLALTSVESARELG